MARSWDVKRWLSPVWWWSLRLVIFTAEAMRHALALTRLAWEDARVLRRFRRQYLGRSQTKAEIALWSLVPRQLPAPGVRLRGLARLIAGLHRKLVRLLQVAGHYWRRSTELAHDYLRRVVELSRILNVLVVFPGLGDTNMRARLRRLYRRIKGEARKNPATVDPLTTPLARDMQAAVVRYEFGRLFGVHIAPDQAAVLAGYGSVAQTLYEFLRHCGCPRYPPAYESLGRYVVTFIPFGELQSQRLAAWQRLMQLPAQSRELLGAFGSLLVRIRTVKQSFAWRLQRARLQRQCEETCRKLHQDWQAGVRGRLAAVAPAMQATIAQQIAFRMWLQSVQLLVDTYIELSDTAVPSDRQLVQVFELELFDEALGALERNHDRFLKGA